MKERRKLVIGWSQSRLPSSSSSINHCSSSSSSHRKFALLLRCRRQLRRLLLRCSRHRRSKRRAESKPHPQATTRYSQLSTPKMLEGCSREAPRQSRLVVWPGWHLIAQDFRGRVRSTSRPGLSPVGLEQYMPTQQLNKAISHVSEMEMNA